MPEITWKQKALLTAVRQQRVAQIRDMLRNGSLNLNFPQDAATTPLHEAVKVGNLHILKMLVAAGADVNRTARNGTTPRDLAEDIGADDLMIRYLESAGTRSSRPSHLKKDTASESFNQSGKTPAEKPAFTLQTLPEIFEAGKWVGKVEKMQKLWEEVPKRLKDKFDFAAELTEARLKTLKQNHVPAKAILKKSPPLKPPSPENRPPGA